MTGPPVLQHLKTLAGHSAVYGLGHLASRLASVLLLPLYTSYLTPADYGVIAILDLTTAVLAILAAGGIAAAGVDLFGLLAYERGLRVTSSFIIGGTSAALVLLVGFVVLREPLTWTRLLAIVLIATGILLLQSQGE